MIPVDPFDRRARHDPYPVYQFMRTVEPVHRSPVGFWILTRYADCRRVLEDKHWSHDADRILEPMRGEGNPMDPTVRLLRASINFSDPPDLSRHRRLLEPALKRSMKGIAPRIERVAGDLIKLMREKKAGADIAIDYATPLPIVILAEILGIPPADRGALQRWARDLADGIGPSLVRREHARCVVATAMARLGHGPSSRMTYRAATLSMWISAVSWGTGRVERPPA